MKAFPATAGLALLLALPASAEGLKDCVATRLDQGSSPGACVAEALAPCDAEPADAPSVAVLCYKVTQEGWASEIAARMAEIRDSAAERLSAIASVEVKYDMLGNLMQCDRMEALALIGDAKPTAIQRDKARCTAAATGLVLTRLLIRSQDL
jgi:hypothetical protein